MPHLPPVRLHVILLILLSALFVPLHLRGQCYTQVTHLLGTQTVSCTEVTVTPIDGAGTHPMLCGNAPYSLAFGGSHGSYLFTFNPPVPQVKVGLSAVNHGNGGGPEEVSFTVNGNFYPISNLPIPNIFCPPNVEITQSGTVGCCPNCGFCNGDIIIQETINSLEVEVSLISGAPTGVIFSLWLCCPICVTDAGVINDNPHTACVGSTIAVAPAVQTNLENDDLLQYILFSNPADTLGSILATSNNPSFSFNSATMQTGVTYYIAAIAGNNAGGNVDLNDPCLDISNAIEVIWHPVPTVVFSVANSNVCAGACTTVTATFTGTAPFTLTYTSPATGSVTQTFPSNTGSFQVCTLPGSPPGSLVVQATSVEDLFCLCQ